MKSVVFVVLAISSVVSGNDLSNTYREFIECLGQTFPETVQLRFGTPFGRCVEEVLGGSASEQFKCMVHCFKGNLWPESGSNRIEECGEVVQSGQYPLQQCPLDDNGNIIESNLRSLTGSFRNNLLGK